MSSDADYRAHFSARLARLRAESGLTYAAVGEHCGVSHAAVQQWEAGTTVPGQAKRQALSGLFSASFDDSAVLAEPLTVRSPLARGRKKTSAPISPEAAERAARLKHAREVAGFDSAAAAALHLGVPYSSYAGHESGLRGFRRSEAQAYASAFGVDLAWLEFGQGALSAAPAPRPQIVGSLEDRLAQERDAAHKRVQSLRDDLAVAERELAALEVALEQLRAAA